MKKTKSVMGKKFKKMFKAANFAKPRSKKMSSMATKGKSKKC